MNIETKCTACGYQYKTKTEVVDEVIRYKSGKHKGDIKEVQPKKIELTIGHEPFVQLFFKKEVDELGRKTNSFCNDFEEVNLYMCPECGTIKGKF